MNQKLRVGIIGGGQLGMMLLQEADLNAATYTVLEASEDCPSKPYCQNFIKGSLNDSQAIRNLASVSDVITWEIEHIDVDIKSKNCHDFCVCTSSHVSSSLYYVVIIYVLRNASNIYRRRPPR